jgi:hypothetical protein
LYADGPPTCLITAGSPPLPQVRLHQSLEIAHQTMPHVSGFVAFQSSKTLLCASISSGVGTTPSPSSAAVRYRPRIDYQRVTLYHTASKISASELQQE